MGGSIIVNPTDINGCPSESFIIESDVKPDSRNNVTCNPIFKYGGIELVELLYDYWFTFCCPAAVIIKVHKSPAEWLSSATGHQIYISSLKISAKSFYLVGLPTTFCQ